MGRGRLAGPFDRVSVLGPGIFREEVGTKGPYFGSDDNVLVVWLRDFIWRIWRSEKVSFGVARTHRTRDCALCRGEDGQLAGLDFGRSGIRFDTDPRDPTWIRRLLES